MEYRHTQVGYTAPIVAAWLLIVLLIVFIAADDEPAVVVGVAAFGIALTVVIVVFNRLSTTIDAGRIRVAFGWGWPRRTVETLDVVAFRPVRNKWYYGWGIRKVPGGWMYNVWGLDAVEIELKSEKKFRIGTDEPEALIAALSLHTSLRPS